MFSGIWEKLFGKSDKVGNLLIESGFNQANLDKMQNDYKQLALQDKITGHLVVEVNNSMEVGAIVKMLGKNKIAYNETSISMDILKLFNWKLVDKIEDNTNSIIFVNNYSKNKWSHIDHISIGFKPSDNYDYVFIANANEKNVGKFFNYKVIGFFYKSFFNSTFNTINTLQMLFKNIIDKPSEKVGKAKSNNAENNIKNSKISLSEIMYILNQMDSLLNNPIISRFIGGKVSPQQIKQLKVLRAFIQALKPMERVQVDIIKGSRIERIAKGINKSINETKNLCEICKMLLKQMGPFMEKMKNNPSDMMNLLQSGNLQSMMSALKKT